jgi:hypothetical protein
MTTSDIPPTRNPQSAHPGLESKPGPGPDPIEVTASKKVDDLSRHQSKHDMVPKHESKTISKEKETGKMAPAPRHSDSGWPLPGTGKK